MDLGDRLLLFVHAPLGRSAALAPSVTPPHRRVENPHAVIDQPYELLCEPGEGKDQEQLDSSLEGARGAVGEGPAGVDGRQEGNRIDEPVAARHQAKVGEHEQTVERVHGSRLPREPVRQFTAIILQAERLAVPFVLLLHLGGPIAPAQVCDASGAPGALKVATEAGARDGQARHARIHREQEPGAVHDVVEHNGDEDRKGEQRVVAYDDFGQHRSQDAVAGVGTLQVDGHEDRVQGSVADRHGQPQRKFGIVAKGVGGDQAGGRAEEKSKEAGSEEHEEEPERLQRQQQHVCDLEEGAVLLGCHDGRRLPQEVDGAGDRPVDPPAALRHKVAERELRLKLEDRVKVAVGAHAIRVQDTQEGGDAVFGELQVGADELEGVGRRVAPIVKVLVEAAAPDRAEAEEGARPVQAGQQAGRAARGLTARVVNLKVKTLQQPHATLEGAVPFGRLAVRFAAEHSLVVLAHHALAARDRGHILVLEEVVDHPTDRALAKNSARVRRQSVRAARVGAVRAEEPLVRVDLLVVEALQQHGESAAAAAQHHGLGDERLVVRPPQLGVCAQHVALEPEHAHQVARHRLGELGEAVRDDDAVETHARVGERVDRAAELGRHLVVEADDDSG
eukprot:5135562-Prymnesium_polylepis.2